MTIPEIIFYLLLNAFRVYIIYRFVGLFFEKKNHKKWLPVGYIIFYVLNSVGYLLLNNAALNVVINTSSLLLIIIIGYQGSVKRKLFSIAASYVIPFLTEDVAWVIFVKGKSDQMAKFGFFFAVFLLFFLEIIIEKTVRFRKGIDIPLSKELLLVLVSAGSMFISDVLIEGFYHSTLLLIISLCILLVINIAVFYLYEKMLDDYVKQKDEEMYRLQLAMFQNQLKIMQNANDTYKIMRHDMKHHIFMISEYIKKNENEKALQYLDKINYHAGNRNQYVRTGNESIDSIFNYIIDEVNKSGGIVKTDIKVSDEMLVDDFDINVILSNLLLNASEAICKCDKKEIQVSMKYDRGILLIKISNTYNGLIKMKDGEFLSTKQEMKEHGIGIASVRKTVEKYNGEMQIEYTDKEFKVKIVMYVESE